jgi:hypothetical protein
LGEVVRGYLAMVKKSGVVMRLKKFYGRTPKRRRAGEASAAEAQQGEEEASKWEGYNRAKEEIPYTPVGDHCLVYDETLKGGRTCRISLSR